MNTSKKTFKGILTFVQLLLIAFVASSMIKAQTSGVDLSFNAIPEKNSTSIPNFILQPDNKVIVFGNFQVVNGTIKSQIARFNTDGSLDNSFNCVICNFTITNAISQPDGKFLVSGTINGGLQAVVYRLNADGSQDPSFTSPFAPLPPGISQSNYAEINAIQPDGKILVTIVSFFSGNSDYSLYRLNTDGTLDTTFARIGVGGGRLVLTIPQKISVLPDGKILVASNFFIAGNSAAALRRYNSDGTLDSTFEPPVFRGPGGSTPDNSFISDFDFQADGTLVIVGRFISINAVSRLNVAKLMPAGNVDLEFSNSNIGPANRVEVLPDGKVLIGTVTRIYRLNTNGSLDDSFNSPANLTQIYKWTLDSAGRIFLYGAFLENGVSVNKFARLNQDGSIESSFAATIGVVGSTSAVASQGDGKVIFAGDFIRVGGMPRVSIVRVNGDGSLDATFNSGSGFNGTVSKLLIQADGKILVAGNFANYNGTSRQAIARLNADGSLDSSFNLNVTSGTVETFALQPDGKILVGGTFGIGGGLSGLRVVRFNTDGSLDASFGVAFPSGSIRSIVVQSDGKILVGGTFVGVSGFNRSNLVRLNADGTLDNTFNAGNISTVNQIEVLADGKYLVAATTTIVRLNNNGATDTTFLSPVLQSSSSNVFFQILVQPDGSILVGGSFTAVNNIPRANFIRLRPNGVLDNGFFPSGANGAVRVIVRQTDGRVLVGGDFSVIGGVTRLSIARLNVAPYRLITPYDFDGDSRADVAVFRPSNGNWYILPSQTNAFYGFPFGQAGDQIAPADYDGDGKTDVAVFRDVVPGAGNFAYFYILNSSDNSFRPVQFGATGDVPVAGDWDADGKADLAVYRAASVAGGQSNFYYRPSSQPNVNFITIPLGTAGDKPLVGDFDGDGRLDPAVFRPSNSVWYILRSSVNQITQTTFGLSTDIPVPADYDGDGQANIAVFRPSTGYWYTSTNPQNNYGAVQFGASGDAPVPADYDGDGRADVAVFRPSNGAWYLNRSTQGFTGVSFGSAEDKPTPNAFVR